MNQESKNIIVSLDIGTTKVSAIVSRKNADNSFEILGKGKAVSTGVQKGEVANIDKTVKAIKAAILEAENSSSYSIKEVFAGIAGSHIDSVQHRGILTRENSHLEITKADVKSMIRDMYKLAIQPGSHIIHVLPQEYFVDGLKAGNDPVGMCGSRLEADFHIITGKTSAAYNIERSIQRAGLKMNGLILEPLASAASVLAPEEKDGGVVLVDIGGGTTDIAIFYKDIIRHTAVIPFGGNIITKDIEKACEIRTKTAESIKVRFGNALPTLANPNQNISIPGIKGRPAKEISIKNLANIINCRIEEIFEQVFFEIKASGYAKKLRAGIVLTGGGSQLVNIKELVEIVTGLEARIGEPVENISNIEADQELKSTIYATSLGLLKRAEFEVEVNAEMLQEINQDNEAYAEVENEPAGVEKTEENLLKNLENRPRKNWWKSIMKNLPDWLMDEQ